jgi:AcrR family transcriptional regulator
MTAESVTMPRPADPHARSSLLRAAEEVFAERGLAAAKVEDIAKRAGVSKGGFYLHFESKEAAFRQIVETFLANCAAFFASPSEYPDVPEEPDELLDFCIERDVRIYEFLWSSRAVLRVLPACQGDYLYLIDAFRRDIDRRNREWIEHFVSIGLFRTGLDVDLASALMGGAYHDLTIKMVGHETRPPLERWLRFAQGTFLRAFGSAELLATVERRERRAIWGIEEQGLGGRSVRPCRTDERQGASGRPSRERI